MCECMHAFSTSCMRQGIYRRFSDTELKAVQLKLTPQSTAHLEKLPVTLLLTKHPILNGIHRFLIFTTAWHRNYPQPHESNHQSAISFFKIHFNIIIFSLCRYSKSPVNQICELLRRQGKLNANHQLN
jgi:hypothetical protein